MAVYECGDCRQKADTTAEADAHESEWPGHLMFFEGRIPPGYIPDDDLLGNA